MVKDLIGLVAIVLFIGGMEWVSRRIAPSIDDRISTSMGPNLQTLAKWISWISLGVLAIAIGRAMLEDIIISQVVIAAVLLAHSVLMVKQKFRIAFRIAVVELIFILALFNGVIYGDLESGIPPALPIGIGTASFLAIIGSLIIACGGWVCYRAANDLGRRHASAAH